jgi:hypothetical protein
VADAVELGERWGFDASGHARLSVIRCMRWCVGLV